MSARGDRYRHAVTTIATRQDAAGRAAAVAVMAQRIRARMAALGIRLDEQARQRIRVTMTREVLREFIVAPPKGFRLIPGSTIGDRNEFELYGLTVSVRDIEPGEVLAWSIGLEVSV